MYGVNLSTISSQQEFLDHKNTFLNELWTFKAENAYVSDVSDNMSSPAGGLRMTGADISPDGIHVICISDFPDSISYFTCSVGHDLRTMEWVGKRDTLPDMGGSPNGQDVRFGDSGDRVYVADLGVDGIHTYSLSASYEMQSATYESYYNPAETSGELAVDFSTDGTLMFIGRFNDATIFTYDLSSGPWNPMSSSFKRQNDIMEKEIGSQHMHHIATYNNGKNALIRTQEPRGSDYLTQYSIGSSYNFASPVVRISDKKMMPVIDGIMAVTVKQDQKYLFNGDYNKDRFEKIRIHTEDTYDLQDTTYYEFDGTFYSVGITAFPMTSLVNNMTILIRARLNETGGSATFSDFAGGTASNYLRWHYRDSTNEIYIQFYDGTNSSAMYTYTWANDGGWHQFAVTYDTGSGIQVLIDGVEENSNADTDFLGWSGSINDNENLYLGIRYKGDSIFDGDMSDVQVYDYKLTGTELSDLNTDIEDLPTVGPVLNLHNTKGTYCWKDESGNGYHCGVESLIRV